MVAPWIVVSGLDGSGKSTLVRKLAKHYGAFTFRSPYHKFVTNGLQISGNGAQFGDVLTDNLLFATDIRLTNYLLQNWRKKYRFIVSQRGWMDQFIFRSVQKMSYAETDKFIKLTELERPTAIIYLIADPRVAFKRIKNDPNGDKYETLNFMKKQYAETLRFISQVKLKRCLALRGFFESPAITIDTTDISKRETFDIAQNFLTSIL